MKKLLILLAIISGNACSERIIPVQVALKCPTPLILPVLGDLASEMNLLSTQTQNILILRDKLQKARRGTLQDICRSTHGG